MAKRHIGILHPGAMGASVAAAARANAATVVWTAEGRSTESAQRAMEAGVSDAGTLNELVQQCDVILSVCPPHAAEDVADAVAGTGYNGVYVDANAISPARTRRIAETIECAGAEFVDGGLVGPPAWKHGSTRLYLSGTQAGVVADCFAGSLLDSIVMDGPVGAASSLKMVYAAYTKGTTALLSAILAVADHEGVREVLEHEWSLSQPEIAGNVTTRVRSNTAKAWRFVGEMKEIVKTFTDAGLPGEFHTGAETVYSQLAVFRDAPEPPTLDEVVVALRSKSIQGNGNDSF